MLVGLAAVQISAFSIFLFEWLSPAGYDMKVRTSIWLTDTAGFLPAGHLPTGLLPALKIQAEKYPRKMTFKQISAKKSAVKYPRG